MSNEKPAATELKTAVLTTSDISAFFTERANHHSCSVCGTNSWTFVADDNVDFGLSGVSRDEAYFLSPKNLPLVVLVCNHCGNLRMHAKAKILEWKNSVRPEAK